MKLVCQIVLQDLWTQHYLLQIDLPNWPQNKSEKFPPKNYISVVLLPLFVSIEMYGESVKLVHK